jgi:aminoglycoside phosphotransferase (APT) family kinase protein
MTASAVADAREAGIVASLLARLDAASAVPMSPGGSPARLLHVTTRRGEELAVKYLLAGAERVDGHGLGSFREKPRQILRIRRERPALGSCYAEVLDQAEGSGWAAYAMPYYRGSAVTAPLRDRDPEVKRFFAGLADVVEPLLDLGYLTSIVPAPDDSAERVHLERIRRRLWILDRHLPAEVMRARSLLINDRPCVPVPGLLRQIESSVFLSQRIQPAEVHYPVHGDANLGNFLILAPSGFKVLDPRGISQHWDAAYDFAKMLFSLTLLDAALERGFAIQRLPARSGAPAYEVTPHGGMAAGYRAAACGFLDFLTANPLFRRLSGGKVDAWRWRILFTHAFHVIAEAACRLSDRKERPLRDESGTGSACELALGLYLLGSLLLNDLVDRSGAQRAAPEVEDHLRELA